MLGRTLNLGILAHVDAGKTTLTERLLYAAGVIDEIGSVDRGTTQTDSLALEQARGITIKSAVVSFAIGDVRVNLIDTPGHPDFIAEVERVLGVLDGAVLVISAVEGVQPQTRVLMRALQRLHVPTLVFVNKIDRRGAAPERVLSEISARLTPAVIALGSVRNEGTPTAVYTAHARSDPAFTSRAVDLLAEHDEALLAAYVDDERSISPRRLQRELAAQTRAGARFPPRLRLRDHRRRRRCADRRNRGAAAGGGGRRRRPRLGRRVQGRARCRRREGGATPACSPGRSACATACASGATITSRRTRRRSPRSASSTTHLPPAARPSRQGGSPSSGASARSRSATRSASRAPGIERDPSPRRRSSRSSSRARRGQGRAPPRAAAARRAGSADRRPARRRPARDLRLAVRRGAEGGHPGNTRKRLRPRCRVPGDDADLHRAADRRRRGGRDPQRGVESVSRHDRTADRARATDSGIEFRLDVDSRRFRCTSTRSVDNFSASMARYVRQTLQEGLFGWQVTDCVVTMTDCNYSSPDGPPATRGPLSTAADFRKLTPLVVGQALDAGRDGGLRAGRSGLRLEIPTGDGGRGPARPGAARGGRRDAVAGRRGSRSSRRPCRRRGCTTSSASCPG